MSPKQRMEKTSLSVNGAIGFRMTEKIRRSQGDRLGGEPWTRQSPKIRAVPAGPVADTSLPSAASPATVSRSTVQRA